MTHKLNIALNTGDSIRVHVDGQERADYTVPTATVLRINAVEYYLVQPGQRVEAWINGDKRLDYTVPQGRVVLVETKTFSGGIS